MSHRILIVEDDPGIAKLLRDNLTIDGFSVKWAADGPEAIAMARSFVPDLVLLDLMLPGKSGFELCGLLRQGGRPVIIVSARSQRSDKLRGLGLGADDYITKPFDFEELVARIHAVLRRTTQPADRITLGRIVVDFKKMRAKGPEGEVHLTHREFEVLHYLSTHRDRTVHRDQLLLDVWGVVDGSTTRAVDFAISRLRKKIEADPHNPQFIRTVRGDGYSLTISEAQPR
jgi:two-component system alkaline phosphatase synthesis response regulator PhoP